jgi:hypothetical protein
MRPQTVAPPRRPAALSALAAIASVALALAGCSLDLDLPAAPTTPTVTGFSPAAAYAGQLVWISGSHFEHDANANTVNFALGSARGERWDGAQLVVRVPADAGDGPLTVSSRDGTSGPTSSAFDYRGLGEPRRVQIASSAPILHHPRAVHPVTGDVVIDSRLYARLVWAGSSLSSAPGVTQSAGDASQQFTSSLVYSDADPVTGLPRLVVADGATGGVSMTQPIPFEPAQIIIQPPQSRVLVFGTDTGGAEVVSGFSEMNLSPLFGPITYGIDFFFGAADQGNGAVVIAGMSSSSDLVLWTYNAPWSPPAGAPPAAVPLACTPTAGLTCPPPLALASNGLVPLAGSAWGSYMFAAAAIDGGDLVVAQAPNSGPATVPEILRVVETLNPSPIESLVASTYNNVALATKPADGFSVAFDLGGGGLKWMLDSSRPTATGAGRDLAYIANDDDNDVVVANWVTGQRVARVNFDVAPGADGFADAAAWIPSPSGLDGDLIFPTTAFPGLVRFPIGTEAPAAISSAPDIGFVTAASDARAVWAVSSGAVPFVEGFLDGAWAAPVAALLPTAAHPRRVAARGRRLAVAHDQGLSLIDADAAPVPPATAAVVSIPSATAPLFYGLGFTTDGDVWAVVERDDDVMVGLWSPAAFAAGGLPVATWTVPGTTAAARTASVRTAALLEDGLWVFWTNVDTMESFATLFGLGSTPTEIRTVPASDRLREIHAVSPNGRLLVHREVGGSLGFAVRFFRADPDAGFPEVGSLVFTERVEAFAFDATGERLFVLTQSPDRVITID